MKPTEHSVSTGDLSAWCPHFDHHDLALTHDNVYQIYEHLCQECRTRDPTADSRDQRNAWTQSTNDLTHSRHYRAIVDDTTWALPFYP